MPFHRMRHASQSHFRSPLPGRHCNMQTILVTGGAGFIGSCFVRQCIAQHSAGSSTSISSPTPATSIRSNRCWAIRTTSSCKATSPTATRSKGSSSEHQPTAVVHFAAESHVDRSIDGPARIRPHQRAGNVPDARCGAAVLEAGCRKSGAAASASCTSRPTRSTGRWGRRAASPSRAPMTPARPTRRRRRRPTTSPGPTYRTYGLPVLVTNCSNNYGPYQFPEKLLPADDPQRRWRASRCPSTATARTSATGSSSRTIAGRWNACWPRGSRARPTTSAAIASRPTWPWSRPFAGWSTSCARGCRTPPARR